MSALHADDAFSSNQPTIEEESEFCICKEVSDETKVLVTNPHCDKIVLVGSIEPEDVAALAKQEGKAPELYLAEFMKVPRTALRDADEYKRLQKPISKYVCGTKEIGPDKAPLVIGISVPSNGNKARLEFNPNRFGQDGLSEIKDVWNDLFMDEVPFEAWLGRAKATRLDIAVDIIGIDLDDILVRVEGKLIPGKWSANAAQAGGIETMSKISADAKRRALLCVYDKRKEQLEKKKTPKFGPDTAHIRIERRVHNQQVPFDALAELENPFADLRVMCLPQAGKGLPVLWRLLAEASRLGNLERCLQYVPEGDRAAWAAPFKECPNATFWDADTIWTGWEIGLAKQGLLDLVHIAKQQQ